MKHLIILALSIFLTGCLSDKDDEVCDGTILVDRYCIADDGAQTLLTSNEASK